MRTLVIGSLVSLLAMLSLLGTAVADTYTVERAVISATGGTATGAPFRLNFTVGQSSVGTQTGSNAKLVSGFWWEVSGNAVDAGREPLPTQFALHPNAPNPFGSRTQIRYAIPAGEAAPIVLGIYDLRGALIKTLVRETQPPGAYSMSWDGRGENGQSVGPGIYFIRFEGPGFRQHRRL